MRKETVFNVILFLSMFQYRSCALKMQGSFDAASNKTTTTDNGLLWCDDVYEDIGPGNCYDGGANGNGRNWLSSLYGDGSNDADCRAKCSSMPSCITYDVPPNGGKCYMRQTSSGCVAAFGVTVSCRNAKFTGNTKGDSNHQQHCYQKKVVSDLSQCNPTPSPPPDSAGGRGDPHMTNIKGEHFNINRQGYAPLVSITSEGASHLEVTALITGVKKCQKKMFMTHVNSSGSWLEKTVAVIVGGQTETEGKAFRVIVDGQEVWSPASRGYKPPDTENNVFNHPDKFSIKEMSGKDTPAEQPGIELKTAHDVKLRIVRPLHRSTAPPHLNFNIQGLSKLPSSVALGGLLGNGDHSQWVARDQECGANFAHAQAESDEDEATSVASAQ